MVPGILRQGPDLPTFHPPSDLRMWEQEREPQEAAPPQSTPLQGGRQFLGSEGWGASLGRRESKPSIRFEGTLPACILFLEPSSEKAFPLLSPLTPPPAADLLLLPKHLVPTQSPSSGNAQEPWQGSGSLQPTHVPPGKRWPTFTCAPGIQPQAATCSCATSTQVSSFQELIDIRLLSRFFHIFTSCWQ